MPIIVVYHSCSQYIVWLRRKAYEGKHKKETKWAGIRALLGIYYTNMDKETFALN